MAGFFVMVLAVVVMMKMAVVEAVIERVVVLVEMTRSLASPPCAPVDAHIGPLGR